MESFEKRLARFLNNDIHEIPGTLLNSIHNFFMPEVKKAAEQKLDRLMFFGTHAIIATVTENVFGITGRDATEFYLKHFVDGEAPDRRFSTVSDDIHEMRNVIAHRWLSKHLHRVAINYDMKEGFRLLRDGDLHVNPDIYFEQFESGYRAGGPIWDYDRFTSEQSLRIQKYRFLRRWLELPKSDSIAIAIRDLERCSTPEAIAAKEQDIHALVTAAYLS